MRDALGPGAVVRHQDQARGRGVQPPDREEPGRGLDHRRRGLRLAAAARVPAAAAAAALAPHRRRRGRPLVRPPPPLGEPPRQQVRDQLPPPPAGGNGGPGLGGAVVALGLVDGEVDGLRRAGEGLSVDGDDVGLSRSLARSRLSATVVPARGRRRRRRRREGGARRPVRLLLLLLLLGRLKQHRREGDDPRRGRRHPLAVDGHAARRDEVERGAARGEARVGDRLG